MKMNRSRPVSIPRSPAGPDSGGNKRKTSERLEWDSTIELGEKFFNEILRHPVPLDLNILKALKRSSLGIDFYLWLTYRTFTLKRPLRLSWAHLYRQFGVDPTKARGARTVNNFRTDGLRELKKIKVAWPDLNYATAQGVLALYPSKPAVPPAQAASACGMTLKTFFLTQNRPLAAREVFGRRCAEGPQIASGAPEDVFHPQHVVIWESFPG